jgi:hypothetical protein
MSEKMTPEREALLRLADALAGDVDRASDSDLLAEAAGDQIDVEKLAATMRGLFEQIEGEAGKARMAAARAAVDADRRQPAPVVRLDAAEARRRLARLLADTPQVARKLTLAARKAEELSDEDVLAVLADLEELGIVPSPDNQDGKS